MGQYPEGEDEAVEVLVIVMAMELFVPLLVDFCHSWEGGGGNQFLV